MCVCLRACVCVHAGLCACKHTCGYMRAESNQGAAIVVCLYFFGWDHLALNCHP